jgi:hypothetical protein
MQSSRFLPFALLVLGSALFAQGGTSSTPALFDDFEGGVNEGGWILLNYFPGTVVIEASGGNPGSYWHVPFQESWGPIIDSTSPQLAGDWRAANVDRMSFDLRLDQLDNVLFDFYAVTIVLRNTKKDFPCYGEYAWRTVGDIPKVGAGWTSFDFAIPSQDTAQKPAGWHCGLCGDEDSLEADWNDIITSIDDVEIYFVPMNMLMEATVGHDHIWEFGLDNIAVHADGSALVRNGSGVNPLGYASTSTPTLGAAWTATVDLATPGHLFSAVAISFHGATEGIFPGGGIAGELLVLPGFAVDVQTGSHAFPVPPTVSLLGVSFATQAATVAGDGSIHLNNALDLVLGD